MSPTIGSRSTNNAAEAGSVRSTIRRVPNDNRSTNSPRCFWITARASSGWNVVAIDTANRPWGSTNHVKASKYAEAMPSPSRVARLRTTTTATWLAATKPTVQLDSTSSLRTAGCFQSQAGRNRSPAMNIAGTTTKAIDAIPAVAPRPSVHRSRLLSSTSDSSQSVLPAPGRESSVAMITRLGRIGLHAAAKNRRRLCR